MANATKTQLVDWLDDLTVRFLLNLPASELSAVPRLCFQVEEAQWFYEDFIRPAAAAAGNPLPSLSLRQFCLLLFQHCPLLSGFSDSQHIAAYEEFLAYKVRVPVRGAILMDANMEKLILVKGWKKGASWSFPRGKINKDEKDLDCAIREVYEETGYDVRQAGLVPENEADAKYIDITMREQHMRLFVFRGVLENTHFEPKTRKEISKIQWYNVRDLPGFKKQGKAADQTISANKFYMVAPFLGPLKKWINQQRKKDAANAAQSYAHAITEDEGLMTEDYSALGHTTDQSDQLRRLLSIGGETRMPQHPPAINPQPDLLAMLQGTAHPIAGQMPPYTPIDQIQSAPQSMSPEPNHARYPSQGYYGPTAHFQYPTARFPPPHQQQQPPLHTSSPFGPGNHAFQRNQHPHPLQGNWGMQHASQQTFGSGNELPQQAFPTRVQQWAQQPPQELMAQGPQGAIGSGPDVPSAERLPIPNLNAHSMNLLNAFRTGSRASAPGQTQPGHGPKPSSVHQTALLDLFKKPSISETPAELPQPTEVPLSPTLTDATVKAPKLERKTTLNEITRTLPKMKVRSPVELQAPQLPANVPVAPKAMQSKVQRPQQEFQEPPGQQLPHRRHGNEVLKPGIEPVAPKTILQRPASGQRPASPKSQSPGIKHSSLRKDMPTPNGSENSQPTPQFSILARPGSAKAGVSPVAFSGSDTAFQPQLLKRPDANASRSMATPSPKEGSSSTEKRDKLLALFGQNPATAVPASKLADTEPAPQAPQSHQSSLLSLFNGTPSQGPSQVQPPPAPALLPERRPSYQNAGKKSQNAPLLDLFTSSTPPNNNPGSPADMISPFALGTPTIKTMPSDMQPHMLPIGHSRAPPAPFGQVGQQSERSKLHSYTPGMGNVGSGKATPTETKGFLLDYLNGVMQKEGNRGRQQ